MLVTRVVLVDVAVGVVAEVIADGRVVLAVHSQAAIAPARPERSLAAVLEAGEEGDVHLRGRLGHGEPRRVQPGRQLQEVGALDATAFDVVSSGSAVLDCEDQSARRPRTTQASDDKNASNPRWHASE